MKQDSDNDFIQALLVAKREKTYQSFQKEYIFGTCMHLNVTKDFPKIRVVSSPTVT